MHNVKFSYKNVVLYIEEFSITKGKKELDFTRNAVNDFSFT